jgi:hypothetical protein
VRIQAVCCQRAWCYLNLFVTYCIVRVHDHRVLQSEVAVHCFPGTLGEMRTHASSGNMRPPVCMSSADGAHNSCPQVLHSQVRPISLGRTQCMHCCDFLP